LSLLIFRNVDNESRFFKQNNDKHVWTKHSNTIIGDETNAFEDASALTDRWVLPRMQG
jgi:hypothetical protein